MTTKRDYRIFDPAACAYCGRVEDHHAQWCKTVREFLRRTDLANPRTPFPRDAA